MRRYDVIFGTWILWFQCSSSRGSVITHMFCSDPALDGDRAYRGCLLGAQAYTEAFQPTDDVALIIHSSYGDHFWEAELQDAMSNSSGPAVLFFQVP